jgi:hypothetical protein
MLPLISMCRSRMLDTWFRDLCSSYRGLREAERALVREFLVLNTKNGVEAAVQERLALGFVEANRGAVVGNLSPAATALVTANPAEYETKSEGGKRRASMLAFSTPSAAMAGADESPVDARISAVSSSQLSTKLNTETKLPNRAMRRASSYDQGGSGAAFAVSSPGGTPLTRAQSSGEPLTEGLAGGAQAVSPPPSSTPKRRTSYAVSVPNAEAPKYTAPKDLPPIDDGSVASTQPSSGGKLKPLYTSGSDGYSAERTNDFSADQRESSGGTGLEEKLLKIGMSGSGKKKKTGCCMIC